MIFLNDAFLNEITHTAQYRQNSIAISRIWYFVFCVFFEYFAYRSATVVCCSCAFSTYGSGRSVSVQSIGGSWFAASGIGQRELSLNSYSRNTLLVCVRNESLGSPRFSGHLTRPIGQVRRLPTLPAQCRSAASFSSSVRPGIPRATVLWSM